MSILLSPRRLQMIAGNEKAGLTLLLHEKLHVIQRLNGPRFESLYQDYGFQRVKLADGEVERLNVMQNPDAFELDWAVQFGDAPSTLVTVFQNAPDGRLRFRNEYRQLNRQPKGVFKIGDVIERDDKLRQWQSGFLLKMGLEHPNETSAYLSSKLLDLDFLTPGNPALPEAHTRRLDQTRKALEQIMRIDGE